MGAASIVIVIGAVVLAVGVGVSFRIHRGKTLIEGARNENSAPWAVTAVTGLVLVAIGVGLAVTTGSKDGGTIGGLLGGAVRTSSAPVANQAVVSAPAAPAASGASSPPDGASAPGSSAGTTAGTTAGCTASATTAEVVNIGNCRSLSYGGIGGAANGAGVYGSAVPGQGLKLQFTSIGDGGDWLISFNDDGRTYALVGDSQRGKITTEVVDLPSTPIVHGNCSHGGPIGGVPCAELWFEARSESRDGAVFLHDSKTPTCMALDTHNFNQAILISCGQDTATPDAGLEDQLWLLPSNPGSSS